MKNIDFNNILKSRGKVLVVSSSSLSLEEYSLIDVPSQLNDASDSRKEEFQKGRYIARLLLSEHGNTEAVKIGKEREPLWPKGFVGSISHSKDFYAAAVASSKLIKGVGLDIESVGRVKENIYRMIKTEEDIDKSELSKSELDTLIFSAKESLYKMLYPSVGKFFGFKDAALISVNENKFSIKLRTTLNPEHVEGSIYNGHFVITKDFLLSYLEY